MDIKIKIGDSLLSLHCIFSLNKAVETSFQMTTYAQKLVKILQGSMGVVEIIVMTIGQQDVTVFLTLLAR